MYFQGFSSSCAVWVSRVFEAQAHYTGEVRSMASTQKTKASLKITCFKTLWKNQFKIPPSPPSQSARLLLEGLQQPESCFLMLVLKQQTQTTAALPFLLLLKPVSAADW
ncbi:hypothetical protein XENOCAPTIV_026260 [Xenoophorus captivus]|uniref:Uncharacterized protein n=1 Tax=Xenoophorus captivus TaxID=1517983 RepID=A0ABV0Q737_9TELE